MKNANLHSARRVGDDEFYTRLPDIEKEARHYATHFNRASVLCNCDDPRVSAFFAYFSHKFEDLRLERLVATCYKNRDDTLFSRHDDDRAVSLTYEGDRNGNRVPDPEEIGIETLDGDGDFRSPEVVKMLKQADIVVTNPPFSLFREYVSQLVEHGKRFLIVGNKNAITYKDVFPLIRDGKMWMGMTPMGRDMLFDIPAGKAEAIMAAGKPGSAYRVVDGKVMRRAPACWFTNLEHDRRRRPLPLHRLYDPETYPRYDNYDAINVDKVMDIPCDYDGAMGVPITFLDKHCPEQFEILGITEQVGKGFSKGIKDSKSEISEAMMNGKRKYVRLFIRRRVGHGTG